jgi:hypothetical protein
LAAGVIGLAGISSLAWMINGSVPSESSSTSLGSDGVNARFLFPFFVFFIFVVVDPRPTDFLAVPVAAAVVRRGFGVDLAIRDSSSSDLLL